MKKSLFVIVVIISLSVSIISTLKSAEMCMDLSSLFAEDIEALSYTNEGPGTQGHRQKQAVWCGGVGGWVVREGCCFGATECTYIYCPQHSFSCDGNTWISF